MFLEILSIWQLHILLSRTAQIFLELHFCVELHTKKPCDSVFKCFFLIKCVLTFLKLFPNVYHNTFIKAEQSNCNYWKQRERERERLQNNAIA